MEQKKFAITRKSKVKPLFIELIDQVGADLIYKRKHQVHVYVLLHKSSECYYTIHYTGLAAFNYERLIEFIIELKPKLNIALN